MNPQQIDEDKIIRDALAEEQKLAKRAHFDMMRMGMRDPAKAMQEPQAQEMLGKSALARAIMANMPAEAAPKGPARRKSPRPAARKRQRQARKTNR